MREFSLNKIGLTYQNIVATENYGILNSRKEANTIIDFCGYLFSMPIVPANMKCVISFELAEKLARNNYFYILHRYYSHAEILEWLKNTDIAYKSISVGISEEDFLFLKQIKEENIFLHFITIDVAKAYAVYIKEMIDFIKENFPKTVLIVGNVSGSKKSIEFLQALGAQAIKVGQSFGRACTTYLATSFGSPMFSFAQEAAKYAKVPLILDGGIKHHKDIAVALIASSEAEYRPMIMIGSLFAACIDSPAELIDGYKYYYGSSSRENNNIKNIEGQLVKLPLTPHIVLEEISVMKDDLSSAISYAGGENIDCFKHVDYKIIL